MSLSRGEFSSRLGFVLAASGSAVGLGNIWGFPTQAASHGGAAFLMMYVVMAFCLAYPVLMAELIIGRHAKANSVAAMSVISNNSFSRKLGASIGFLGIVTSSLILCFYSIVAGWMISYLFASLANILGLNDIAMWFTKLGVVGNALFVLIFLMFTAIIVSSGVKQGIEKWSARLMPLLLIILLMLIGYVLTLDGAVDGLKAYFLPDFKQVLDPNLMVKAMGQAFFSLSLAVGTMLIYGSYINKKENLVVLGCAVTLVDITIAVMAGLLILPAMYVAQHNGIVIYDEAGLLIAQDKLIFTVLPALFDTMGVVGAFASLAFFLLMTIAALTSSISMLEVPVAYAVETYTVNRNYIVWLIASIIAVLALIVVCNFKLLFGFVVTLTTGYSQPLLGLALCIFTGWMWHRNKILLEISQGYPNVEHSLFWKVWPFYIRYVCPAAIIMVFGQQIFN